MMAAKKIKENQKIVTTFHLDSGIHQWLKMYAVAQGKPASTILEELIIKLKNQVERKQRE